MTAITKSPPPVDDVACDLLLAAHGVDRDQRVGQVDLLQEQGDRRDLVGLLLGGDLAQGDPFLAGPGADDVQRAEAVRRVVGPPAGLAVDGDRAGPGRSSSGWMAWAIQSWKHFWKASGFRAISRRRMQSREGMPLGSARNCSEPIAAIRRPSGGWPSGRRSRTPCRRRRSPRCRPAGACGCACAGVGEGLEVGADRFDVDPFGGHARHPGRRPTARPRDLPSRPSAKAVRSPDVADRGRSRQTVQVAYLYARTCWARPAWARASWSRRSATRRSRPGFVVLYRSIFDVVRDFLHDEALSAARTRCWPGTSSPTC